MILYGTYKSFATGKWTIEEIPVLKETTAGYVVERTEATAFKAKLDKKRDGFYTQAITPEIALLLRESALKDRIEQIKEQLRKAESDLWEYRRDTKL